MNIGRIIVQFPIIFLLFNFILIKPDNEINWPNNYLILLKVRVGNNYKIAAFHCDYFNKINIAYLDLDTFKYDLSLWHKVVKQSENTQKKYSIKIIKHDASTENPVPHVCCVSILNGTCSHLAQLHIKPTADLEDLALISQENADELAIEPLDTDELFDEVHTQMELARLTRFGSSVPEELITNEPVPQYMIILRRLGIATLLYYLKMQEYVTDKWHQLKSWTGYNNAKA